MYLHIYACTCTLYIHVYIWMLKIYLIMVCTMCHATFSISRGWKHTTYQHMVLYMLTRLHCSNNIYELTWLRYRTGWKCFKSNHFDKRYFYSPTNSILSYSLKQIKQICIKMHLRTDIVHQSLLLNQAEAERMH